MGNATVAFYRWWVVYVDLNMYFYFRILGCDYYIDYLVIAMVKVTVEVKVGVGETRVSAPPRSPQLSFTILF